MDASTPHSTTNDALRQRLGVTEAQLADFCRRWKITELAVFGSALRNDFRPDSDVDLLVQFAPDAEWGLMALARLERELEHLLRREVDVLTRGGVEASKNWIRREAILSTAQPIISRRAHEQER
jgi:hypothetical protein